MQKERLAPFGNQPFFFSLFLAISKPEFLLQARLLLVQSEVEGNGDSHRSTYHRVVAHTQEAHHLDVSRH